MKMNLKQFGLVANLKSKRNTESIKTENIGAKYQLPLLGEWIRDFFFLPMKFNQIQNVLIVSWKQRKSIDWWCMIFAIECELTKFFA